MCTGTAWIPASLLVWPCDHGPGSALPRTLENDRPTRVSGYIDDPMTDSGATRSRPDLADTIFMESLPDHD